MIQSHLITPKGSESPGSGRHSCAGLSISIRGRLGKTPILPSRPGSALWHREIANCPGVADSIGARTCPQKTGKIDATPLMTPTTALGLSIRVFNVRVHETGAWDLFRARARAQYEFVLSRLNPYFFKIRAQSDFCSKIRIELAQPEWSSKKVELNLVHNAEMACLVPRQTRQKHRIREQIGLPVNKK